MNLQGSPLLRWGVVARCLLGLWGVSFVFLREGNGRPLRNVLAVASEGARRRMRRGSLTWSGVAVGGVILILGSELIFSSDVGVTFAPLCRFVLSQLYSIQSPFAFFNAPRNL